MAGLGPLPPWLRPAIRSASPTRLGRGDREAPAQPVDVALSPGRLGFRKKSAS